MEWGLALIRAETFGKIHPNSVKRMTISKLLHIVDIEGTILCDCQKLNKMLC